MSDSKRRRTTSLTPELTRMANLTQLDFEIDFYSGILEKQPDNLDVLRAYAKNLALAKRHHEGVHIDQRIAMLLPRDAIVHYNLACSYALTSQMDFALDALRQAMELGYRDFKFIQRDGDLDQLRKDPRFSDLLREFEARVKS
ncbi:MAG: hypothetical protein R3B84_22065 [Zavarzinella sp.]